MRTILALLVGVIVGAGGMYLALDWPFGGDETARVEKRVLANFAAEPAEFGPKLLPTAADCTHRVAKVYACTVTYEDGRKQRVTVAETDSSIRVIGSD
jgi:hypothetical protein